MRFKVKLHAFTTNSDGESDKRLCKHIEADGFHLADGTAVFTRADGTAVLVINARDWYQVRLIDDAA